MGFFKKNMLLIVILVVFAAALVVSIVLLRSKKAELEAVRAKRDGALDTRSGLWDAKPISLDAQNIKIIQESTATERKVTNEALTLLRRGTLTFEAQDEVPGQTTILQAIRRMSETLKKKTVAFPEKFQFGFDQYVTRPPRRSDTPMIQKQLAILEEFVRIISEADVRELTTLKRVVPEDSAAASAPAPRPGAPMGPPGAAEDTAPAAAPATSAHNPATEPLLLLGSEFRYFNEKGYLYTVMPFQLEVVCDTDTLRKLLNSFTRSKYTLITRALTIANSNPNPMAGPAEGAPAAAAPSPAPAAGGPGEADALPSKPDPDELPWVIGEETLRVSIRVDWFEFHPETKIEEKKDKPRGGAPAVAPRGPPAPKPAPAEPSAPPAKDAPPAPVPPPAPEAE